MVIVGILGSACTQLTRTKIEDGGPGSSDCERFLWRICDALFEQNYKRRGFGFYEID